MEQDEVLSLPTRRTTQIDNVARVQADLANHATVNRHVQDQSVTFSSRSDAPPQTIRLHEEPLGEDQQALLAEFERRRRVKIFSFHFFR